MSPQQERVKHLFTLLLLPMAMQLLGQRIPGAASSGHSANRRLDLRVSKSRAHDEDRRLAGRSDTCSLRTEARQKCFDSDGRFLKALCNERAVAEWLAQFSHESEQRAALSALVDWNYNSNITNETQALKEEVDNENTIWYNTKYIEVIRFPVDRYSNKSLVRMLKQLQYSASLCDEADIKELTVINTKASTLYNSAKACVDGVGCLAGETEFDAEMERQTDYDKLLQIWKTWHDLAGPSQRVLYERRTQLLNKGAHENGWPDAGYFDWFTEYEIKHFDRIIMGYWQKLLPLYRKLHAYVRYKLRMLYPGRFGSRDPIPVHLLGGMWGQNWSPIINRIKPFINISDADITPIMLQQNFRPITIFKMADEFYSSIGLYAMTDTFWNKSIIERPSDGRSLDCHGSAYDMVIDDDYRILICTEINSNDFYVVHHEMGHIEYNMAYRKAQPFLFRNGANNAFHEAIGDSIALSVMTPQHLHKIGLLNELPSSQEFDINFLMKMALQKVGFLQFGILMDAWRWRTLNESISPEDYNHHWWKMRVEIGGIMPPEDRLESTCFDPGAKYHIASNVGYIRYFLASIFQFQILSTMCSAAGHIGPLHRCDIYQKQAAGEALLNMLKLGSSIKWQDAIAILTEGADHEFNPDVLLDYFKPLERFLDAYLKKKNVPIGWKKTNLPVTF